MTAGENNPHASAPAYLQRYGLQIPPFSDNPDSAFFYLDSGRAQCLDMLEHLSRYAELLLIVQGEHGAGKTSLLEHFVQRCADSLRICRLAADPLMDADRLLRRIAAELGLGELPQEPAALQNALYAQAAALQRGRQAPLLVVDDAHALSPGALAALFHLADAETAEGGKLVRLVLFCEPQIQDVLDSPDIRPLRERITHTLKIPPLSEEQTAEYLRHRMRAAGAHGDGPFTARVIQRVYKRSQGLPARINAEAVAVLAEAGGDAAERDNGVLAGLRARLTPVRAGVGLAALGLVLVVLAFQGGVNEFFGQAEARRTVALELPPAPAPAPERRPDTGPEDVAPDIQANWDGTALVETPPSDGDGFAPDGPAPQDEAQPALPRPAAAPGEDAAAAPAAHEQPLAAASPPAPGPGVEAPSAAQEPSAPDEASRAASASDAPPPAPALHDGAWVLEREPDRYTIQLLASRSEQNARAAAQGYALPLPLAVVQTRRGAQPWYTLLAGDFADRAGAEAAARELPEGLAGGQPWVRDFKGLQAALRQAEPLADRAAAPLPSLASGMARSAWLWSQNPSHYTLQLLSTRVERNVQAFIGAHALEGRAVYFRVQREGRDWYTLIHGVYPDRDAAARALRALPPDLRQASPWPRTFASIHAELPAP